MKHKRPNKYQLKQMLKEKWLLFLGSGLFLIGGVVALLVGFSMTGWSIIEWLKSPYATTTIILVVLGLFFLLVIVIMYKKAHLGEDD